MASDAIVILDARPLETLIIQNYRQRAELREKNFDDLDADEKIRLLQQQLLSEQRLNDRLVAQNLLMHKIIKRYESVLLESVFKNLLSEIRKHPNLIEQLTKGLSQQNKTYVDRACKLIVPVSANGPVVHESPQTLTFVVPKEEHFTIHLQEMLDILTLLGKQDQFASFLEKLMEEVALHDPSQRSKARKVADAAGTVLGFAGNTIYYTVKGFLFVYHETSGIVALAGVVALLLSGNASPVIAAPLAVLSKLLFRRY
jgi:hypothetical protein